MAHYYGINTSSEVLAHYGVKGMRWGVRRALANDNEKVLDRHYRKAAKKLAKLQDIGINSGKYAAKSAGYGAAAAGVGTLAIGGTKMLGDVASKPASAMAAAFAKKHGLRIPKGGKVIASTKNGKLYKQYNYIAETGDRIKDWGGKAVTHHKKGVYFDKNGNAHVKARITNNDLYRIGTGAVAAGLLAKSAQNAYRAANGKKYREKAVQWQKEMDDAFAGTKYAGHYEKLQRRRKRR